MFCGSVIYCATLLLKNFLRKPLVLPGIFVCSLEENGPLVLNPMVFSIEDRVRECTRECVKSCEQHRCVSCCSFFAPTLHKTVLSVYLNFMVLNGSSEISPESRARWFGARRETSRVCRFNGLKKPFSPLLPSPFKTHYTGASPRLSHILLKRVFDF